MELWENSTDSMEFFLNGGKLPLNSVGQFKDPVRYLCLVGCVVLTILICAHNLYLKMKRTKYLAKPLTQKVQVWIIFFTKKDVTEFNVYSENI